MASPFTPPTTPGAAGYPLALTGATAATRYVGATSSGAPASGTFVVGDFVIDQTGKVYICTAAGSPGTWTQAGSSSGTQLDYVEYTSGVLSVTATSDATAQAYVTGTSQAYAASRIRIECFTPLGEIRHTAGCALVFNLYDGATDLGELGEIEVNSNQNGASAGSSQYFVRYLTPTAATHQYIFKVWKSAGTANVYGSAGGTATLMPAFIRVSLA